MAAGPLRALLVDGVIKGVGSVLVFLPQILILFAFIAVLEDCGYMARAAFLMDRLMSRCGLSGKSFIPLLSSVACAVPGIMATRVIENRRDRLATILVAPLMSCSARLPVYVLLIGAFLHDGYRGVGAGAGAVRHVRDRLHRRPAGRARPEADAAPGRDAGVRDGDAGVQPAEGLGGAAADARRGRAFVVRAGTIILAAMILVWALLYFPHTDANGKPYDERIEEAEKAAKDCAIRLRS